METAILVLKLSYLSIFVSYGTVRLALSTILGLEITSSELVASSGLLVTGVALIRLILAGFKNVKHDETEWSRIQARVAELETKIDELNEEKLTLMRERSEMSRELGSLRMVTTMLRAEVKKLGGDASSIVTHESD